MSNSEVHSLTMEGGNQFTLTLAPSSEEEVHSLNMRNSNRFTLSLTTPIAQGGSGGSGESGDYNSLYNKPSINDVELVGNLTLEDLGIFDLENLPFQPLTIEELDQIIAT